MLGSGTSSGCQVSRRANKPRGEMGVTQKWTSEEVKTVLTVFVK